MTTGSPPAFDSDDVLAALEALDDEALDRLDYGVIGFDADYAVSRYNATESRLAAMQRDTVLGQHVFASLAQCMNNYLVAQRFEDAAASGAALDATLDYVLTLRMKPTKVRLRLLAAPQAAQRYLLLRRRT
ncbi:MAG: phosphonate transporter [Burkholderiales bacterium]|nr:phosphonate transporter [Burkholderiales bacterium]MDE1928672.1 phosphonate transporter [Burkholderiales bacterium]MDE2159630.1 phosphonate transporter [Burkholderiales bacterium]MDE2504469.1 phosphonate transporter [Burkholderiales bacterium]